MSWDSKYRKDQRLWGDRPSALAAFACHYLQHAKPSGKAVEILDIGCGYGRDAKYFARSLDCHVIGIDSSSEAINMARKGLAADLESRLKFECGDFKQLTDGKFDIIFASNFYHLLNKEDRPALRETIRKRLQPGGMLFLSMLSPRDPEHYGKGKPVDDDDNSFKDEVFLHFCTRDELETDFRFLTIKELSEHEYYEPRSTGEVHHHFIWLLVGQNQPGHRRI
jgi:cyclopropane fatty-acyl-phospholipid synthase-like methyltransferase